MLKVFTLDRAVQFKAETIPLCLGLISNKAPTTRGKQEHTIPIAKRAYLRLTWLPGGGMVGVISLVRVSKLYV